MARGIQSVKSWHGFSFLEEPTFFPITLFFSSLLFLLPYFTLLFSPLFFCPPLISSPFPLPSFPFSFSYSFPNPFIHPHSFFPFFPSLFPSPFCCFSFLHLFYSPGCFPPYPLLSLSHVYVCLFSLSPFNQIK